MRLPAIALGALGLFALSAPAQAYCCWNPAICKAVCGSACCGADLKIATPVDSRALANFEIQDLMSTYNQAEQEDEKGDFVKVLGNEIKRRGGRLPGDR